MLLCQQSGASQESSPQFQCQREAHVHDNTISVMSGHFGSPHPGVVIFGESVDVAIVYRMVSAVETRQAMYVRRNSRAKQPRLVDI